MHTSPSGKMYVGITSRDVRQRWQNGRGYIKNDHFYRAIQKYGWNKFDHEVIAENLTKDEACEMEKVLIKELKSNDYHFGYNLSAGGEGGAGIYGYNSHNFIDLTGQRFGKLTVLKYDESTMKSGVRTRWICKCDCGNVVSRYAANLKNSNRHTCGKCESCKPIQHGAARKGHRSKLYSKWSTMKSNCTNPNRPRYHVYGGKGISICDEWLNDFGTFQKWALDHGFEDGDKLCRKDMDKNFEPNNCYIEKKKKGA